MGRAALASRTGVGLRLIRGGVSRDTNRRESDDFGGSAWVMDEEHTRVMRIQRLRQQYLEGTLQFESAEVAHRMLASLLHAN